VASVLGHAPVVIRFFADTEGAANDAWFRALASASPSITYRWIATSGEDARDFMKAVGLQGSGFVIESGVDREIAAPSLEAFERAARELVHAPAGDVCRGAVAPPITNASSAGVLDVHAEPLAGDLRPRATSVRIDEPNRSVTLVKDGAHWKVSPPGVPADEANVEKIFETLAEAKMRDAIPADASLDLTTHVVVTAGTETLLDFTIGRDGHRGTAIRLAGAPTARVASPLATWALRRELRNWRERTIWQLDTNDVQRVEITNGRSSNVLTKRNGQWQARAEQMLGAYRHPISENFPSDTDVGKDASVVRFTMAHGPARVMRIGAKRADGTFPARVEGDPTLYAISSYTASFVVDPAIWRTP
jgi:hypothetical protein